MPLKLSFKINSVSQMKQNTVILQVILKKSLPGVYGAPLPANFLHTSVLTMFT